MFIKIFKLIKTSFIIVVSRIINSNSNISIQIILKEKLFKMIFSTENNQV